MNDGNPTREDDQRNCRWTGLWAVMGWAVAPSLAEVNVTSLLTEMADRDRLARAPVYAYQCKQFSSYDRASDQSRDPRDGTFRPDEGRDWGKGWFANGDFGHYLRNEVKADGRVEHVLMDHQGPGAIVRVWIALMGPMVKNDVPMRIYQDGAEEPVIALSHKDLVGGTGLVGAPFSVLASGESTPSHMRGRNLILPIPYQKGCKVTIERMGKNSPLYYIASKRRREAASIHRERPAGIRDK